MRFLVVEDDFGSRRLLQAYLKDFGACDVVVDGDEAVEAFRLAWEDNEPYHVIFLDIMMPNVDGHEALRRIRKLERDFGLQEKDQVSVIMTSALEDPRNVVEAYYQGGATAYMVKPIRREVLVLELQRLGIAAQQG